MISRRAFLGALGAASAAGVLSHRRGVGSPAPQPGHPSTQEPPYALVLGSVQDGGMPQAGCYSDACDRAREQDPRYVTSLALVFPERGRPQSRRFYLVDASPDLRQQMDLITEPAFRSRAQARRPFDGIFLTHAHMGHYLGLALLGREGLGIASTPCYCSAEMRRFLTENGPWSLMVREGRLHFPEIEPDRWQDVDGAFQVKMTPVPHRPEFSDTVAFQFRGLRRTLLYLPDIDAWNRWERRIDDVVNEVDVALLDGAFFRPEEVPGRRIEDIPHPMIPDTMARLESLARQGKRIVFTHLNNTNPVLDEGSSEAEQVVRRGFEIAREGTVYPL